MRLLQTFGRFPFLFVLGVLGTPVVAAYAIGRGEDSEATGYGWQTLRIALATQLPVAALLVIAARPIALAFGTEHVGLTVTFIRVFGLAVAGFSISRTISRRWSGTTWLRPTDRLRTAAIGV